VSPRRPPVRLAFALQSVRALPIRGASGVAASRAGLLLVEDDLGIYRLRGATASLWAGRDLHPALGDLEGIATSDDGGTVWALAEDCGTLIELRVTPRGPDLVRVTPLPRPGTRRNKGYEGLTSVPAALSPTRRAALVAVHEHKPRRVRVFDRRTLALDIDYQLPRNAKRVLDDLADVAIDPLSGLVVLLSEESRRLAVMRATPSALELLDTVDLPLEGKERPEGLAYVTPSRLVVATEGPARLLSFRVTRRAALPV
jgi:uncharacterized protein YjiK